MSFFGIEKRPSNQEGLVKNYISEAEKLLRKKDLGEFQKEKLRKIVRQLSRNKIGCNKILQAKIEVCFLQINSRIRKT